MLVSEINGAIKACGGKHFTIICKAENITW